MAKADRLRSTLGATIGQSIGAAKPSGLPSGAGGPDPNARFDGTARLKGAVLIPVPSLHPDPGQPRKEFDPDELRRLADSLRDHGQIQPLRVRWDEGQGGRWVIVVGERRWRAAKLAGLASLACVEDAAPADPLRLLDLQLVENAARDGLKPVEQARAFRALMDARGWNLVRLAAHLNLTPQWVGKALTLLDLPGATQEAVDAGEIPGATAVEIARLPDADTRQAMADAVVAGKLSRDDVRDAVRSLTAGRKVTPRPDPVTIDLGEAVVTVRWKRASTTTAATLLRAAMKSLRDHDAA